ncbi:eukaryotic translation initiation factor-like protein 2 subunit beta [Cucurbitaria berberidis CBS 394.84]|uniref:Eukaryotic translation initiation factor-like protein 2 subunit beta n=1 Tax=Cucurbitaria berberidis CBS 394.84 TaxID=1168544 RepID=A0A9P4L626_9PLEO|nr:eukaryotic translation initiation factor-like protein 2 subunit beta [Cucurbitaria berberidis CBS 394.84]KAF1842932.1 eukaryotic translation initiation factor-like protein 2 subunit beta [Cucurbitaria berberidis CBS 394.84]
MADTADLPERKPRKSVAFSEGATIVDSNGEITESIDINGGKSSAESHASGAPPADDKEVEEVTDMFADLAKKKKKKKSTKKKEGEDEDAPEGDFAALKKKKKSSKKKVEDDFEAKLAAAGGDKGEGEDEEAAAPEPEVQEGDMMKGTGIWQHESTTPISYNLLLNRFFTLLHSQHPDLASSGTKSYKIPPPQCLREGNKKTIFANIAEICKRMKRTDEHVTQFLFAELGTSGSVDGSRRLVIKGRFQQKQIENVLRRYIVEYVTCKTCRSPDTDLSKGENRLNFVTCNSCGSRRSVQAIKTGFSAQIGKRRRMVG